MLVIIALTITTLTACGYAAWLHFKGTDAQLRAALAADLNKILNDIRADEKLLTTHPYQIISRIRAELREIF